MGMLAGNGAGAGCCFYAGTVRAGGAECGGKTVQGPGRHYPAHDVEHAVSGEKGAAAGPDADGGRAPRFFGIVHSRSRQTGGGMSPGLPQGVLAGGCHEQGLSSAYGKREAGGKGIDPGVRRLC